jgi:hypothetical protein
MAVEYLDKGNDDGTVFGQDASEKIGFYGASPITQPALTLALSTPTTSLAGYGFSTAAQASEVVQAVNWIMLRLRQLGLAAT